MQDTFFETDSSLSVISFLNKQKQTLLNSIGFVVLSLVFASTSLADNNLGEAGNYNLFVLEDFESTSSDVQGAFAAGGNVTLDSYGVASTISAKPDTKTLIVGGDLIYVQGELFSGSGVVGGSIDGVNERVILGLENGATLTGNESIGIDFADEFSRLTQLSTNLSQVETTGAVNYRSGGFHITGDCQSQTQVFNLDGQIVLNSNHVKGKLMVRSSPKVGMAQWSCMIIHLLVILNLCSMTHQQMLRQLLLHRIWKWMKIQHSQSNFRGLILMAIY